MVSRWILGSLCLAWAALGNAEGARSQFSIPLSGGREATVHVFTPEKIQSARQPALLMWHGGGWTAGFPGLLFPHAETFAAAGYVCLVPEYPLATVETGIGQCTEDAREIAAWIGNETDSLKIDPDMLYLLGESAGGHLAAMLATDPDPLPWAGLILWNPVLDLRQIPWLETARYGVIRDRAALSPLTRLAEGHPPTLIIHGADDTVVPVEQAVNWRNQAHRLGVPCRLAILPETQHAFVIPESEEAPGQGFKEAIERTLSFLRAPKHAADRTAETPFQIVHAFSNETGWQPFAELSQHGDEAWGSGHSGGAKGRGTLFRLDLLTEHLEVVHHFSELEGYEPFTGHSFGEDAVWGVTKFGGSGKGGTLYRFQPSTGGLKTLAAFGPNEAPIAWHPHAGPILVEGYLWGTTFHGGPTRWGGALYRVPAEGGALELMQGFDTATGEHPTGQLLLHQNWIYGTLSDYEKADPRRAGALFRIRPDGSGFEIVHRFAGAGLGAHPYDRLVLHPSGRLLGTTFGRFGSGTDRGTLFAFDPDTRAVTTLIDFNLLPAAGGKPNGSVAIESANTILLTTHGHIDSTGAYPGTALRVYLAQDPNILSARRIEILHTFSGDRAGGTPMRTPLFHAGALWGLTAFGHDGPAKVSDQTQTGGLLYRLTLPGILKDPTTTRAPGGPAFSHRLWILLACLVAGFATFYFLRKR